MKRNYSTLILIVILSTGVYTGFLSGTNQDVCDTTKDFESLTVAGYSSHGAILISDNSSFQNAGFTGSGSQEDPYILSDVQIIMVIPCIDIRGTSAYFIIENSHFKTINDDWNVIDLQNVTNGIFRNCTIESGYNGLNIIDSANTSLVNCTINDSKNYGLDIDDCSNISLINTTVCDVYRFIYQLSSYATLLDQCWFNNSVGTLLDGDNTVVTNCTFSNGGNTMFSGSHVVFRDNFCYELGSGMFESTRDTNYTVSGNTFISCAYGISISAADNIVITNNTFYRNSIGIFFQNDPRSCTVANNTLYRNDYSIVLSTFGSSGTGGANNISHNIIGWNNKNAKNTAGYISNWDDGISGNSWSRYSGTGVHVIDGGQGDVDNYPSQLVDTQPPVIESSGNYEFIEGSTGNYVRWNITDDFPYLYTIQIDDIVETRTLIDDHVILDFDSFAFGTYSVTITAIDGRGNSANDSVVVNVIDATTPTINGPDDFTIVEGTTGNQIIWETHDTNPKSYTIFGDDEIVVSSLWSSSEIIYSLDSLSRGLYNLTLVIEDIAERITKDTVFVTVSDDTAPIIEPIGAVSFEDDVSVWVLWQVYDLHPSWMSIYLNDSLQRNTTWDGDGVFIQLGFLDVGVYNLTLHLIDIDGNSAIDSVIVLVYSPRLTETTSTTTSTTTSNTTTGTLPPDNFEFQFMSMFGLGLGSGLAILAIVLVIQRRR